MGCATRSTRVSRDGCDGGASPRRTNLGNPSPACGGGLGGGTLMQPRSVRPDRARNLRGNPTDVELLLWQSIRKKQLHGHRFRRQVPLGPYVADFVCIERSLIVEVDGVQLSWGDAKDLRRTRGLEGHGWRVVGLWHTA